MAMTNYGTLLDTIAATKTQEAAFQAFYDALLADAAEIKGAAAVQADVESACDELTANLQARGKAILIHIQSKPAPRAQA